MQCENRNLLASEGDVLRRLKEYIQTRQNSSTPGEWGAVEAKSHNVINVNEQNEAKEAMKKLKTKSQLNLTISYY